ncbi:tetraspanin-14-like [Limulus polyphemus]|uniref:Tetraspanin-14-like n=1 Tax=Limulus polyphemus TaxID=6850 RepID=A0ABM1BKN3_LIMPO|nr:tetraspanin-14-like [Limulus polyphemus]
MFLNKAMRYYRFWIYSCNLALFLSVLIFVSLAAWTFTDYRMTLFPTISLYHPTFVYAYLALILQGGILQVVGCLGALKLNERLLNIYWSLMLMLLLGDIIIGFVWIFHYNHIASHLLSDLKTRLQTDYGSDVAFQFLWDRLQQEEYCCGVIGPQDFNLSTWFSRQRRAFTRQHQVVPLSCCEKPLEDTTMEDVIKNHTYIESFHGIDVYQKGCFVAVFGWFQRSADMLSVLGFCVISFLKVCFLGILRYEIREMIQKIKILKDIDDTSSTNVTESLIHIPKSSFQKDTSCSDVRLDNHVIPNYNVVSSDPTSKDTNGNNNDTGRSYSLK